MDHTRYIHILMIILILILFISSENHIDIVSKSKLLISPITKEKNETGMPGLAVRLLVDLTALYIQCLVIIVCIYCNHEARMSGLDPQQVSRQTKNWTFPSQNVLNSDLKRPGFAPFRANLTQFGTKLDIPVTKTTKQQLYQIGLKSRPARPHMSNSYLGLC